MRNSFPPQSRNVTNHAAALKSQPPDIRVIKCTFDWQLAANRNLSIPKRCACYKCYTPLSSCTSGIEGCKVAVPAARRCTARMLADAGACYACVTAQSQDGNGRYCKTLAGYQEGYRLHRHLQVKGAE